jgi:hypothetical protein
MEMPLSLDVIMEPLAGMLGDNPENVLQVLATIAARAGREMERFGGMARLAVSVLYGGSPTVLAAGSQFLHFVFGWKDQRPALAIADEVFVLMQESIASQGVPADAKPFLLDCMASARPFCTKDGLNLSEILCDAALVVANSPGENLSRSVRSALYAHGEALSPLEASYRKWVLRRLEQFCRPFQACVELEIVSTGIWMVGLRSIWILLEWDGGILLDHLARFPSVGRFLERGFVHPVEEVRRRSQRLAFKLDLDFPRC